MVLCDLRQLGCEDAGVEGTVALHRFGEDVFQPSGHLPYALWPVARPEIGVTALFF